MKGGRLPHANRQYGVIMGNIFVKSYYQISQSTVVCTPRASCEDGLRETSPLVLGSYPSDPTTNTRGTIVRSCYLRFLKSLKSLKARVALFKHSALFPSYSLVPYSILMDKIDNNLKICLSLCQI